MLKLVEKNVIDNFVETKFCDEFNDEFIKIGAGEAQPTRTRVTVVWVVHCLSTIISGRTVNRDDDNETVEKTVT